MKRVTYDAVYSFNRITISDGAQDVVIDRPESLDEVQRYLFTRFLAMVDRGNTDVRRAMDVLAEGRRCDAARYLMSTDSVVGEYAEWLLPTLLGIDGAVSIIVALELMAGRSMNDVRDAVRNYPWKAEGVLEFQRRCEEILNELRHHIGASHDEAKRVDVARSAGFDLSPSDARCRNGSAVFTEYLRLMKIDAAPRYSDVDFYFTRSGGYPVAYAAATGYAKFEVNFVVWERAIINVVRTEARAAEKRAARKGVR